MSTGSQVSSSTTNSQPWGPAQPYLQDIMSRAQGVANDQTGQTYRPDTYANPSATTQGALGAMANYGMNGDPNTQAAGGALNNFLGGNGPGSGTLQSIANHGYSDAGAPTMAQWANTANINPYLDAQYNAASKPVIDSVNAQFSQGGRTGSVANQDALTTQLGGLAANIYGNGYENAANRSLNAAGQLSSESQAQAAARSGAATNLNTQQLAGVGLAPSLATSDLQGLGAFLGAGQGMDQLNQQQQQNILDQFAYSQQQPWSILNNYAGAVSGLGGIMPPSTTATNTQPGQSMIPGLLGMGTSLALAPMTGGGSLFGSLFSDRRLKTDIVQVGTASNGLPLYLFRYKGDHQIRLGLMAQDVEKVKPDAIVRGPDNYMRVDYARALAA